MSRTKSTLILVAVLCGALLLAGVQPAQADKNLVIAGSSVKGTWYRFAGGVASLVDKYIPGYKATATPSPGSVKNVRDLRSGEIDLGMLLPSAAFQAYKGLPPYEKEKPFMELRALFNTYSFPIGAADRYGTSGVRLHADHPYHTGAGGYHLQRRQIQITLRFREHLGPGGR